MKTSHIRETSQTFIWAGNAAKTLCFGVELRACENASERRSVFVIKRKDSGRESKGALGATAILKSIVVDFTERALPNTYILDISSIVVFDSGTRILLRRTCINTESLIKIKSSGTTSTYLTSTLDTIGQTLSIL